MVPKVIPESERKQPVSISLTAVEIVMLNKLAESNGKNRSEWLAGIIRASAQIKMGLSELETHAAPVQKWKGACNPLWSQGRCTHSECVKIYKAVGV
jgi:hypothetical protein